MLERLVDRVSLVMAEPDEEERAKMVRDRESEMLAAS